MKLTMKLLAVAVLLAPVAFADDNDDVKAGPDLRPLVFVDEKSIENKTTVANANFGTMIDRLNNALTESGIYRVLTPKDIGAGLVDDKLFQSLATDGGAESTMKTPAFKVCMAILQYGFAQTSGTDMYGASSETRQAKIELVLKVVDMRSKEIVKSKNILREATGISRTQNSNMSEQLLQNVCKMVVDAIVDELVKLTPFSVMDVENGEVAVDVPASRIKVGQQLVVYKLGKKIRNKRTGKVTAKESQCAVIGVVTIGEDSVTCKLLSGEIKPNETAAEGSEYDKYIVRLPDTQASSAPMPTAVAAPTTKTSPTAVSPF